MTEPTDPAADDEPDLAVSVFKLAGLFMAAVFVCLGISWVVLTVGPPDPVDVCEHKLQLALAEGGDQPRAALDAMLAGMREDCVKEKERRLLLRGKISYWKHARCVLKAETFAAADQC
ncbi:MAG: hypothetical protein R3A51_03725 [Nannocystaceae bacterium]|nr:hypothetical protein [Myxococcales bacterium]